MIAKAFFTIAVVAIINVLAKRYPALGGYMAVLPIVTFLSLITLGIDQKSSEHVSSFLTGALSGIALTSIILVLMLFMVRGGLDVGQVVLFGLGGWAVVAFVGTQLFS